MMKEIVGQTSEIYNLKRSIYMGWLMKILACYDEKNYADTTKVLEKSNVRGIIIIDGKIAMQRSSVGEYKIPGGGMEEGEDYEETLSRELREEVGLVLIKGSMRPLGEITEIRKDIFAPDTKYISHSLFFACEVTEERLPIAPTLSEQKKGYVPAWVTLEELYETNSRLGKDPWIKRDTAFIKMLMDKEIEY